MTLHDKIRKLRRTSKNGFETTFSMHCITSRYYRWELIRYPLDVKDRTPTETLIVFEGRFNWDDAINKTVEYLNTHPDDGFYDD